MEMTINLRNVDDDIVLLKMELVIATILPNVPLTLQVLILVLDKLLFFQTKI